MGWIGATLFHQQNGSRPVDLWSCRENTEGRRSIVGDLLPCHPDLSKTGTQINQGRRRWLEASATDLFAYPMSSR